MTKPSYSLEALADLERILAFIARDKPLAAVGWVERLEAKCLLIASSPEIGEARPELGAGVRATASGRYVIFHRYVNDRTEILRVIPGDRDITTLGL